MDDRDGLNAFSGILQNLEIFYKQGFFWGLPEEDFHWALLWRAQEPLKQRTKSHFPSWSWAAWEGALWSPFPFDATQTHQFPIYLTIWKAVIERGAEHQATNLQLAQFFKSPREPNQDLENSEIHFPNDPISLVARLDTQDPDFDIKLYLRADELGYLFIEGIMFHFMPDYRRPRINRPQRGVDEVFNISI